MKITIDIDCSPTEARAFLGLPDIKPLQDAFMAQMQEKMASGLSAEDLEKMFNLWMKPGLSATGETMGQNMQKNMEAFQSMFWQAAKGNKE
ncbi:DUF6489 family protein [Paremcibacter congregatus]|uniref:Ribosomal protein S1 n=1 Tax=Paremcibacter congregatus TaxID=2043170 RepID=A0A2G4YPI8_9PROT|nr:DUF6489 family protein [Paremcibacter congregatus]PHZ84239.1 hypothetical protein CRD36_13695 [Paremcibacter congregatus]QDE29026.1 hypothetical protein FIV45_17975 [Paremcibacter congregatus]